MYESRPRLGFRYVQGATPDIATMSFRIAFPFLDLDNVAVFQFIFQYVFLFRLAWYLYRGEWLPPFLSTQ